MFKPFKTYEEQIALLKQRGLIIDNDDQAISMLQRYNYYNFINAYSNVFLASTKPEKFVTSCNINHIEAFMKYDKMLQSRFLSILLNIENMIKSVIAYEFAKQNGAMGYRKKECFRLENDMDQSKYKKLLSLINKIVNDEKLDYIEHYKKNYKNYIPIWVLVNAMTFGNIVNFYSLLKPNVKNNIANAISSCINKTITEKELINNLQILKHARNICAHGQRMYCFKPPLEISSNNNIVKQLTNKGFHVNLKNLNALFIAIYQLSNNNDFMKMSMQILNDAHSILNTFPSHIASLIGKNMNFDLKVLQIFIVLSQQ